MSQLWLRLTLLRGVCEIYSLCSKYIEISFDKSAEIDTETVAADIKQYFQIIMILAYFLGMKGLSTPPTFTVFQL